MNKCSVSSIRDNIIRTKFILLKYVCVLCIEEEIFSFQVRWTSKEKISIPVHSLRTYILF